MSRTLVWKPIHPVETLGSCKHIQLMDFIEKRYGRHAKLTISQDYTSFEALADAGVQGASAIRDALSEYDEIEINFE